MLMQSRLPGMEDLYVGSSNRCDCRDQSLVEPPLSVNLQLLSFCSACIRNTEGLATESRPMVSSRACYRAVCRCPSDVLAPAADRDRFRRIPTQRCSLVGHGSASAHLPQSQLKAISAVQADADADIPLPDEGPEREGDESEDSHNADGQPGSDDEGEDLQDGAER